MTARYNERDSLQTVINHQNMNSGEVAAIVAVVGMLFNYLGITSVNSDVITGAINGIIAICVFGAGIYSWYVHRTKPQPSTPSSTA